MAHSLFLLLSFSFVAQPYIFHPYLFLSSCVLNFWCSYSQGMVYPKFWKWKKFCWRISNSNSPCRQVSSGYDVATIENCCSISPLFSAALDFLHLYHKLNKIETVKVRHMSEVWFIMFLQILSSSWLAQSFLFLLSSWQNWPFRTLNFPSITRRRWRCVLYPWRCSALTKVFGWVYICSLYLMEARVELIPLHCFQIALLLQSPKLAASCEYSWQDLEECMKALQRCYNACFGSSLKAIVLRYQKESRSAVSQRSSVSFSRMWS